MFRELSPSRRTQLSFTFLMMGLMIRGYRPGFGTKTGWSLRSKLMGNSNHYRYSRVAGETVMTSRVVSFCFPLDLLMSFREVTLWSRGGRLEHLICETLESVAILGLVLSLGMEDTNAIQEAF
jgi:hypothetical protein